MGEEAEAPAESPAPEEIPLVAVGWGWAALLRGMVATPLASFAPPGDLADSCGCWPPADAPGGGTSGCATASILSIEPGAACASPVSAWPRPRQTNHTMPAPSTRRRRVRMLEDPDRRKVPSRQERKERREGRGSGTPGQRRTSLAAAARGSRRSRGPQQDRAGRNSEPVGFQGGPPRRGVATASKLGPLDACSARG